MPMFRHLNDKSSFKLAGQDKNDALKCIMEHLSKIVYWDVEEGVFIE